MTVPSDHNLIETILAIPTEDRTTEFKRLTADSVKKTIESIVALANTDGGIIVVGVDDPQKTRLKRFDRIYGIEEDPEKFDEIGRNIQRISPPISNIWPPLIIECDNGKKVALINIPKALDRDRKSTRLNSSHIPLSRMPSSA